jgi:hypothetical protein
VQSLRDQANARAAKLSGADRKRVVDFAAGLDEQYKALVTTREGGWMSGEEQFRERVASLYGAVNTYDGRPADSQLAESGVLAADLAKKSTRFDAAIKPIAVINRMLAAHKLEPLTVPTGEDLGKEDGGAIGGMTESQMRDFGTRLLTW